MPSSSSPSVTIALRVLLLLALLLPPGARGATLEQALLFLGDGHSRLLLVLDAPASGFSSSSAAAVGSAPARATLFLLRRLRRMSARPKDACRHTGRGSGPSGPTSYCSMSLK